MAPHTHRNPSSQADMTPATPVSEDAAPSAAVPSRGPPPGNISIADQYTFDQKIRRVQRDNGCDPAREDSYRLQGIQLIDNVREALQL
jgi:CTD kinase subunit beta